MRAAAVGAALAGAALAVIGASGAAGQAPAPLVVAVEVDGTITPVMADHVRDGLRRAEREGAAALLIEMDTPGGLDASMRRIVRDIIGAGVPVVVYVAPSGARAASAGAIIALSSHVAAMAPGTNIGAATPIDLAGGETSPKVLNDAAAYAASLARLRDRDVAFARDAVLEGRSEEAEEAVRVGAVDLVAANRTELLADIDGRIVEVRGDPDHVIATAGAEVVVHDMGTLRRVLQWLTDPNIAFLFLSLGTLALMYELADPGVGIGAAAGVILIVLALYALAVLPVNAAGLALLVLAAVLFAAELFAPGIGVFAAGGTAALITSGLFLFRGSVAVDAAVVVPTAVVVGGGVVVAGRLAWGTRHAPPRTGVATLLGEVTRVETVEGGVAQVRLEGAWWEARPVDGPLAAGDHVRVVAVDGLDLVVEPVPEPGGDNNKEGP